MNKPSEIAFKALKTMREKEGIGAVFPSDKIWLFTDEKPDSSLRPGAINWLRQNGYIETTGRMTNAVTEARAGSKTPEYRFGASFTGGSTAATVTETAELPKLAEQFRLSCSGVLQVNDLLQTRLLTSLFAKRFLVLTGLAGSGKTKLGQALARWITPDPGWIDPSDQSKGKNPNPFYTLVPVGADWTGNENIIGYADGLRAPQADKPGYYVTKPALELIRHAADSANAAIPHFLILDEMNLSHVERYFADLLSAIESGEAIPLHEGAKRFDDKGKDVQARLTLPDNLFILGTVNVDETTYMFSPKVLDRANVIEFRVEPHELNAFLASLAAPNLNALDGAGIAFAEAFAKAAARKDIKVPTATKSHFDAEMNLYFAVLRDHGAEFGYRVAYEAASCGRPARWALHPSRPVGFRKTPPAASGSTPPSIRSSSRSFSPNSTAPAPN